jgi:hypothetical protein
MQTRLFERLFRVSESRDRQSGGAGLGLSLCREIALAHGGQLKPVHRMRTGTMFRLIIRTRGRAAFSRGSAGGRAEKVWRFLQRIVSNGLALKTAILRGDELKKFPHACKPETKKQWQYEPLVGNFIGINFKGALQLRAFV